MLSESFCGFYDLFPVTQYVNPYFISVFIFQIENNMISNNKPGKRERSYDNLKTGKLHFHHSFDNNKDCVITRSPHLWKIHYEPNDGGTTNGRMQTNEINSIFASIDKNYHMFNQKFKLKHHQQLQYQQYLDERFRFVETCDRSTESTTSSFSSLTPLSSPTHIPTSHVKLIPTLIPAQYRVYVPQKKCQMDEFYTDYVYSADQTIDQMTLVRKHQNDNIDHLMDAKAT